MKAISYTPRERSQLRSMSDRLQQMEDGIRRAGFDICAHCGYVANPKLEGRADPRFLKVGNNPCHVWCVNCLATNETLAEEIPWQHLDPLQIGLGLAPFARQYESMIDRLPPSPRIVLKEWEERKRGRIHRPMDDSLMAYETVWECLESIDFPERIIRGIRAAGARPVNPNDYRWICERGLLMTIENARKFAELWRSEVEHAA